uniref:B-cell differentiation antigen CD72-like n=1 Tax=Euleptes europaea TaxID=460621 RepID=UPI00253FDFBB|nr:B-cell differentiation antigen CD72-like [Euleptes europaea]
MAEAVTYAALRFAKSPPGQSRPPPGPADGPLRSSPPAEASDGELTYENLSPSARDPRRPPRLSLPGALPRRIWSAAPLALLAAGLFLAATCIGLGVRYWQVSQQLQRASQRHAAESSALAHRIGGQDKNLTWSSQQLSRAKAELADTWLALQQCLQAANSTQRQLEEEQKKKANVTQELEATKRVLDRARLCQQTDCCPLGWKLFNQKCLRLSSERKTWEGSKQDCAHQGAQLLILKPWDAATFWDVAVIVVRCNEAEQGSHTLLLVNRPKCLRCPSSPKAKSKRPLLKDPVASTSTAFPLGYVAQSQSVDTHEAALPCTSPSVQPGQD